MIGRAGVGVDNIDLEAATHMGIAVINAPRRECSRRGRADAGDDAGNGASSMPRGRADARGQVGEEIAARD